MLYFHPQLSSQLFYQPGKPRAFHRIIEWPGLKRTTMIIEFQPPCYVQGCQPPDQAAQSHIQPGLECLQGWGIHSLLGQPVPVCHHPLSERLPPNIYPQSPLFSLRIFPLVLSISIHVNKTLHRRKELVFFIALI